MDVCDLTFPFNNKLRTLFYLYEDIFKNLNESFCTREKSRREIITRGTWKIAFLFKSHSRRHLPS